MCISGSMRWKYGFEPFKVMVARRCNIPNPLLQFLFPDTERKSGSGDMEVAGGLLAPELQQKQQVHGGALVAQPPVKVAEPLNPALQQQLNLESVRTRAQGLYKTVSRILEDFDAVGRTNALPKW